MQRNAYYVNQSRNMRCMLSQKEKKLTLSVKTNIMNLYEKSCKKLKYILTFKTEVTAYGQRKKIRCAL